MIYSKYMLKIGLKNKLNFIPLLLPMIIMLFLMMMNTQAMKNASFVANLNQDIQIMHTAVGNQTDILATDSSLSKEDEQVITESNSILANNIRLNEQAISFAEAGKWTEALTIQLNLMEQNELRHVEANIPASEDFKKYLYMNYASYKELSRLNAEPQQDGLEMKGANYVYRMMDSIFPVVFMICLVALISNMVNASIIEGIDIEKLFPESPIKFQLRKIMVLTLFGLFFYVLFLAGTFALSSALNGVGTFQYPINIYDGVFDQTKPLINVVLKAGILQCLSLFFVISCVYFVSLLAKNGLITLFVSTVVLLGAVLLTGQIAPMAKYLHFLPTTYVNAIRVVNNQLAFENNNPSITFSNGAWVLLLASLLVIFMILAIKVQSRRQEMLMN
jgi:hypothetical protein